MGTLSYDADPRLLVVTASFSTYYLYKRFEPSRPAVHAALLLGIPTLLCFYLNAQLSVLQAVGVLLSHWSLILAFTAIYRLSPFHPLAKYPGPALGKLTKFYVAYRNARGDLYVHIRKLHQQYGDVVRVGPNELSFNRVDALQPIYASKTMKKGPYYDTRKQDDVNTQLDGVREFTAHAARRRPWTKALSPVNIKQYDEVVVQKSRELIEELAKRQGETIDLSHWMNLYGFDFMGHLAFGREFGMLKAGKDTSGLIHVVEEGVYASGFISQFPWILPIFALVPAANKGLLMMQRMSARFASDRTKAGSHIKDLYYYLTEDESAAQSGVRPDELIADGMLAVIAGSDTTAIVLSHFLYYMMRHPECAEHLRREIDKAFPNGEEPLDFARLAELPYLNACINEALRLLPPALSGLQRRVELGSGGAMVGPYFVPEGTQVSVPMYTLHRNLQEFSPLPDTFWPDRWLTEDTYVLPTGEVISKDQVVTNKAAFVPFSLGPQNCVGKALAQVELRAIAAALVQRFDVRKAKEYDLESWEKDLGDAYITLRGPLPAVLTPRQPA